MNKPKLSSYAETQNEWNSASKATRQAMLEASHHDKNTLYSRAFAYLPSMVREDLIGAHLRSLKTKIIPIAPKPLKHFWFQEIGG